MKGKTQQAGQWFNKVFRSQDASQNARSSQPKARLLAEAIFSDSCRVLLYNKFRAYVS